MQIPPFRQQGLFNNLLQVPPGSDALISDCQVSQRWNNQLTAQRSSESQNHTEWEVQSSTVLKNVGEKYKKKYWEKIANGFNSQNHCQNTQRKTLVS